MLYLDAAKRACHCFGTLSCVVKLFTVACLIRCLINLIELFLKHGKIYPGIRLAKKKTIIGVG